MNMINKDARPDWDMKPGPLSLEGRFRFIRIQIRVGVTYTNLTAYLYC